MTEVGIRAWKAALLAVNRLADEGNRLLVDACGVPALDGGVVCLSLLVTGATLPAMADKEVGRRSQRIGTRTDEIDTAVAVEINAAGTDVLVSALVVEQPALALDAAGVAGQAAVGADRPVAGNDQPDRVGAER